MLQSVGIVGTGIAGATVAIKLREHGFEGRILMFGDEEHHAYDRPSLSKAALSDQLDDPVRIFPFGWDRENAIELHTEVTIARLDLDQRALISQNGDRFPVDRIVLATGVHARRLTIAGADLPGVLVLRTWRDMEALRLGLKPGCRLSVIGGGLVGCEIATTATKLGAVVTVFEAGPELLERVLGPTVGKLCRRDLEAMGVEIKLDARVRAIEGSERVTAVRTADGTLTEADLVLVSIGGVPADELAAAAGLLCRNGIVVNGEGRTSVDTVFAAGDVANWPLSSGSSRSLETYLNAQAQAECVASALMGEESHSPQLPKGWTEIAGRKIQVVGDIVGPGTTAIRQQPDSPSLLMFRTDENGILAAALAIDAPGDFAAAMRLVSSGYQPQDGELADASVALRDLVRKSREKERIK